MGSVYSLNEKSANFSPLISYLLNECLVKRKFAEKNVQCDYNEITLNFIRWQVLNPGKKFQHPPHSEERKTSTTIREKKIDIR